MKKPSKTLIHGGILLVIFLALKHFDRPWYEFALGYIAYFAGVFLLFLPTSLGNLGYYIQVFLKKQDLANKLYEKSIKMNTKSNYALTAYGLELLREGNPEKALPLFQRNLDLPSSKPIFIKYNEMNLATCYWKLGDVDKSIAILEDMHEKYDVFSEDFYTTLGFLYYLKDDLEQALYFTKKALHKNREHGPAYDNMGQIHRAMGESEKAIRYFEKGLRYKEMIDSKYYLGLLYEEEGDIDTAKEFFQEAYNSKINGLNTITREEVDTKYNQYF